MSATLDLAVMPTSELRKLVKIAFFTDTANAELQRREDTAQERIDAVKANGAVIAGHHVTYKELLVLATLTRVPSAGKANWYGITRDAIPSFFLQVADEVATALEGVQSREANALKSAIETA